MPKTLSIIIPFYNEIAYLRECLDSIRIQRLEGIETIIVNDNPGDFHNDFVEKTARAYGARFIHHEENKGLSAARNTGLDAATGEFTTFIDSDDYYVAGGLADLLAFAASTGSEITHMPTLVKDLRGEVDVIDWDKKLFLKRRENVNVLRFPATQFIASSWSSIYRTDYLEAHKLRFDAAQRRFEDRLFVLEAVLPAERVSFFGSAGRMYRRRPGSITMNAAKADEDRLLQALLSKKCVDLVESHVKTGRLSGIHLQRELMISLQRLIFNSQTADMSLPVSDDLRKAREIFSSIFTTHRLEPRAYADRVTLPISKIGHGIAGSKPFRFDTVKGIGKAISRGDWSEAGALYAAAMPKPGKWAPVSGEDAEARLVLHVGAHKTGTTHAQRRFEAARLDLKAQGVLFPETGFRKNEPLTVRDAATPGHVDLDHAIRDRNADVARALLEEAKTSQASTVLVSAENMSNPLRDRSAIAYFVRGADWFFKPFAKRRVVAIYRRPDEFLDSYFRELVFLGNEAYQRSPDRFAFENGDLITNLPALFSAWTDFATDGLRIMEYEAATKAGVAESVLSLGGIDAPLRHETTDRIYPSPGRAETIAARFICSMVDDRWRRTQALAVFLELAQDESEAPRGPLLSPDMRMTLIDKLEARSAAFARDHGLDLPFDAWRADIEAARATWDGGGAASLSLLEKAREACMLVERMEHGDGAVDPGLATYRFMTARARYLRSLV